MTAIRSASWSASSRYWVVSSTVVPSRTRSRIELQTWLRLRGSSPVVGSSRNSIGACVGQVEAIEQLGRPRAGLGRCEVKEPPEHLQVLAPGQQLVHCGGLPREAD